MGPVIIVVLAAALAGSPPSDAAAATPGPGVPRASATSARQITTGARPSVDAGQIAQGRPNVSAPSQISPSVRTADAPPPLSSVAAGRNAQVGRVTGQDRCDPVNEIPADKAECAQLAAAAQKAINEEPPPPAPLNPGPDAASLVDGIVKGGTGTVVPLPPPK